MELVDTVINSEFERTMASDTGRVKAYEKFKKLGEETYKKLKAIADSLNWTSVEDRLPENNIPVLASYDFASNYPIILERDNGRWWRYEQNRYYDNITHWTPLPEAPKSK